MLEHIRDDAGTLDRIRTVLQPGAGRLVLLVPNGPDTYGTVDEALGHYRRYTREGLATLLTNRGYNWKRCSSSIVFPDRVGGLRGRC